jgi:hypothetical protein
MDDDTDSIDSESFSSSGHQRRSRSRSSRISTRSSQRGNTIRQQSLINNQDLQNRLLEAQIETQIVAAEETRVRTRKMELENLIMERNLQQ